MARRYYFGPPRLGLRQGEWVIFWLFASLSIGTAAALTMFANTPLGAPRKEFIYRAMLADLAIPVVAYCALLLIGQARRNRAGKPPAPEPPTGGQGGGKPPHS